MKRLLRAVSLLMLGVVSAQSQAEIYGWRGEVELGVVETRGNSTTSTMKFKSAAVRESEQWIHDFALEALNTSSDDETTAERYLLEGKAKYRLPEQRYWFGNVKYEDNRFSGYDYQATVTVGYGARIRETPVYFVDLEAGPGARRSVLRDNGAEEDVILRLFGEFDWTINQYASFNQKLTVEAGQDSTNTKSETGLKSKIAESLALKAGYIIRHASSVPVGTEKTDRELTLTVVYDFK